MQTDQHASRPPASMLTYAQERRQGRATFGRRSRTSVLSGSTTAFIASMTRRQGLLCVYSLHRWRWMVAAGCTKPHNCALLLA